MSEILALAKIKLDGGTQMRSYIDSDVVSDYAAMMKDGDKFPALSVVYDGENYWLTNGYHRYSAAIAAGLETFPCIVTPGMQADAQWDSYAANKLNGKQRTRNDVQRAIEAALLHPNGATMSDRQIAKHVGCSSPTIAPIRARLIAQGKIQGTTVRTGADGRKIETAGIGLKDQLANWHGLIFQPFMEQHTDADFVFIHQKDGPFLHIVKNRYSSPRPLLSEKYHLDYGYVTVQGASESLYCLTLDKAYVEFFEREGLKIYIEEFDDLSKEMQSLVKRGFSAKQGYGAPPLHTFIQVDSELKPGDLVARRQKHSNTVVISEIVVASASFVQVRARNHHGENEIWLGSELCALEFARQADDLELSWDQVPVCDQWVEQYYMVKRYYAPQLLLAKSGYLGVGIAIGEDAERLNSLIPGILTQDSEIGHVFVTMNSKAAADLRAQGILVRTYDARSEALDRLWKSIINTMQGMPAPSATPIEAWPAKRGASDDQRQRETLLWSIWHALKHIEGEMEALLDLDSEEADPLIETVPSFQTIIEIVGEAVGIAEEDREFVVVLEM